MEMTRTEITEKLKDILVLAAGDTIDPNNISEDAVLTTDLGLNSVGILYIVIAIEEFFRVRFDNVSFGDFKDVKSVIDYIEAKLKEA